MSITLVLGRDRMGQDATEADYHAWVDYVDAHILERAGVSVRVETRHGRDVQTDDVRGGTDEQRELVAEAKAALWQDWCAEGAPNVEVP